MAGNAPPGGDHPPSQQHRGTDNLAPEYFRGLTTENANIWMISIDNWRTYRQMNEKQTKAAIPLFSRDVVALWYHALLDNKKDTLVHLKTAFKDRCQEQDREKWKRAGELFNLRQTAHQPVPDFLTNIEMLAKKADLNDAQTVFAAVNGLTSTLRQAVLTTEASMMENVRKWATIAGRCHRTYSTNRHPCNGIGHTTETHINVSYRHRASTTTSIPITRSSDALRRLQPTKPCTRNNSQSAVSLLSTTATTDRQPTIQPTIIKQHTCLQPSLGSTVPSLQRSYAVQTGYPTRRISATSVVDSLTICQPAALLQQPTEKQLRFY